jgi:hypothetical protein
MTSRLKQVLREVTRWTSFLTLAACTVPLLAQRPVSSNFTGVYVLQTRDAKNASSPIGLKLVQGSKTLEVTDDSGGKVTTNTYPLDGTSSPYTTPTGFTGVGSVKLDDKALTLETLVAAKKANSPVVHFRTTKRIVLSADRETLKVHTEVFSPEFPAGMFPPFDAIYKRSHRS